VAAADTGALGPRSAATVLREGAGASRASTAGSTRSKTLEEQLQEAGLPVVGPCGPLTAYGEDLLHAAPLLQDLTSAEADILGDAMLLVRAEPGQVLIREGDAGDWMMLVLKGTVDVSKRIDLRPDAEAAIDDMAPQPQSSRVAVIKRGAAVGEMSMLDNEPRYSSCTAIEAVEAGVLGRHEIALLIRDHPGVGAKLLVKITQLMAQRLRNTSNHLVKLLRKNTADRS
jgi:CRP/FNR family cyclic AMP-dependent transcriptional regulator